MEIELPAVMCVSVCVCWLTHSLAGRRIPGVIPRNVGMGCENGHGKLGFRGRKECRRIYGCVFGAVAGPEVFMRSGESNLNCGVD